MNRETIIKAVGPIIMLALGVGVFMALVKTRPEVAQANSEERAPLVQTIAAQTTTHTLRIPGQGTVMAARQVVLQPEVSGRVIEVHPQLVAGGLLNKGETAVKLDGRDYRLAITQQRANVQRAQFELELEQGLQKVAQREWELFGEDQPQEDDEAGRLALRKPHIRNVKASLASARSAVAVAANNLARTQIEVPFNALVLTENVDDGMLASPQTALATLVGTDVYWVQVALPYDHLPYLKVPGLAGDTEGSKARITLKAGPATTHFEGRVLRMLGDMDPIGRLARIVVEVEDPLNLRADAAKPGAFPLLLGAFVQVDMMGSQLTDVVALPRTAMREGDTIWVVGKDNTLQIRTLSVVWRTPEQVFARKGVTAGEQVVVSRLDGVVDGMAVRVGGDEAPQQGSKPTKAKTEVKEASP